jgi:hypothetical protein
MARYYVLNIKVILQRKHMTTYNPQTHFELYLGTRLNTSLCLAQSCLRL